jgi:hypothetical protein
VTLDDEESPLLIKSHPDGLLNQGFSGEQFDLKLGIIQIRQFLSRSV